MKRFKMFFLKCYNTIIGALLTMLGFSLVSGSCNATEYGVPADEYGVPYATFKVSGTVESSDSSNPIEDIRVLMGYGDTAFTDKDGNYSIETEMDISDELSITFKDVDGNENGSYNSLDTVADFSDSEFSGGEDWYMGTAEEELNIKLDKEE